MKYLILAAAMLAASACGGEDRKVEVVTVEPTTDLAVVCADETVTTHACDRYRKGEAIEVTKPDQPAVVTQ